MSDRDQPDRLPPAFPADPSASDEPAPSGDWEATLASLETSVMRLEDAVRAEVRPDEFIDLDANWAPPADLGPLPDHLRERATLLLARQLEVVEELVHEITWSKRQRDVAARMSQVQARPAAAFIDNRF